MSAVTETVSASALAAETLATAPAVTVATAPVRPGELPDKKPGPEERDSIGRLFDASKFRPEKDSLKRWKNLRGGAPRKDGKPAGRSEIPAAPASAPSFVAPDAPVGPVAEKMSPRAMTVETCIGLIQTALVLIGEEEGVLSEQEKMLLRMPLDRVIAKYDVGEMPCELDLAVAAAVVVISRLKRPKTATWFAKVKAWCTGAVFAFRGRKLAASVREHVPNPAGAN